MGKRRIFRSPNTGTPVTNRREKKSRKCKDDESSIITGKISQFPDKESLHENNEDVELKPSLEAEIKISTKEEEIALLVPYNNKEISVVINCSTSKLTHKYWIILTHGAGGDLNTPQLKAISKFMVAEGFIVARFTCKGLNIKYRRNVFLEVFKTLCVKYIPKGIFVGGRSMGARAAVMLDSDKLIETAIYDKVLGIICLSYPLHKVNDMKEMRDAPLLKLQKPVFFLSGTQDEMCQKPILEKVLQNMESPYKIQWLENYNHSAKSNHDYQEDTYKHAFSEISKWCQQLIK